MKDYICFVLLVAIASCVADDSWLENNSREHSYVQRPCPHNDLSCIRRYFLHHSHCKEAHGPAPDPFHIPHLNIPIANANLTLKLYDAKIKGLNGKVCEFTINKETDKLVIAAEMRDVIIFSPKSVFRYHRLKKEPIDLADEVYVRYESLIFTAVIPNINHLDLQKIEVFSYVPNGSPPFAIGPGAVKSMDPVVKESFKTLLANIPTAIKEAFIFQGPMLMIEFLQNNICDFGLRMKMP